MNIWEDVFGLKEADIVKRTGISRTSIANYTQGRSKTSSMKMDMASKIAISLGITLDDFYIKVKKWEIENNLDNDGNIEFFKSLGALVADMAFQGEKDGYNVKTHFDVNRIIFVNVLNGLALHKCFNNLLKANDMLTVDFSIRIVELMQYADDNNLQNYRLNGGKVHGRIEEYESAFEYGKLIRINENLEE